MTTVHAPSGIGISDTAILADIQGNILRGYNMRYVRHLVVRVANPSAARAFIAAVIDGSDGTPRLTTAEVWPESRTKGSAKPTCLNVGVTATGLRALGLREGWLSTFPDEFLQGAVERAEKVGDVDGSAPEHWRDGLGDPNRVHLMWTIHALTSDEIDRVATKLESAWKRSGAFTVTAQLDGATLDTHTNDPDDRDTVHFGYRDSISQPRFVVDGEYVGRADSQPIAPAGSVLLGRVLNSGAADVPAEHYRTSFPGIAWQMPEANDGSRRIELGVNGCFNAFRLLEQDVHAFEEFLKAAAQQINHELRRRRSVGEAAGPADIVWDEERVAAKLMGRWRNGVPLSLSHWTPGVGGDAKFSGPGSPPKMDAANLNDFDYPDDDAEFDDFSGIHCPMGAHIRRANPRGARIVQSSANYTRPLIRRGMPYGPPYDPAHPDDGHRRGLLGNFMCASLIAQYEAVMYDWINLGLQDPRVTGTNDPLIGANDPHTSRFEIPLPDAEPIVLEGFRRFTETVGSIYLFCPSITTLRFLADPPMPTR
jgi:deferrochelatase/peroxidase EfeB